MNYTIQNLAKRPVSIVFNSGKACHLPPKYSGEFAEVEIKGNAMIKKLQQRKVLSVFEANKKKETKTEESKAETKSSKPAKSSKRK